MTTKATLPQLFGPNANQDAQTLTIQTEESLTAEGAIAEIIARLNTLSDFALTTESGAALTTESGAMLRGAISFTLIEFERMPTQFRSGDRVDRFFLGFNTATQL